MGITKVCETPSLEKFKPVGVKNHLQKLNDVVCFRCELRRLFDNIFSQRLYNYRYFDTKRRSWMDQQPARQEQARKNKAKSSVRAKQNQVYFETNNFINYR